MVFGPTGGGDRSTAQPKKKGGQGGKGNSGPVFRPRIEALLFWAAWF